MEESKKIKSLWLAIAILIALNVTLLIWQWLRHPPQQGIGPVRIAEIVKFSPEQMLQFEQLKNEHFKEVLPLRDSIRILKQQVFDELRHEKLDTQRLVQKVNLMATKIKQNELKTVLHFASVRAICTPEQKQVFDKQIIEQLTKQGQPPKPQERGLPPGRH